MAVDSRAARLVGPGAELAGLEAELGRALAGELRVVLGSRRPGHRQDAPGALVPRPPPPRAAAGAAERRCRPGEVSALRAVISRAAHLVDEYHRAHPASDGTEQELARVFAEVQAAKAFVGQAAAQVVNRALSLSGGAGYLNRDPLSRAYRDVRASDFMQPLSTTRAYDFLGQLALGLQPSLS